MKAFWVLVWLIGSVSLLPADILDDLECHDKVVKDGVENLILPKEVEALFGKENVDHFISQFGSKKFNPTWNSVAHFEGRYVFSLEVPIKIDYEHCKVLGALDSATVQINEVVKVEISTSGIAGATLKGQWRLDQSEWKWLVKNHGDWSVVKVPIVKGAPVKDFEEYVRQQREPILHRKEGYDEPIKKARELLRKMEKEAASPKSK